MDISSDIPSSAHPTRCDVKEEPRGKLHSFNWEEDVPGALQKCNIVEVLFKNTRKGYFLNSLELDLNTGDVVAVESNPGHDIGTVTLTGPLVLLQMKRAGVSADSELRRVFRLAKPADLEKYEEVKAREQETMIRSRRIAEELGLNMKIGDVEYQGDGNKAIFYYIADERVDFRQLIKVLAEQFKVRIEMRQIGARQEAGRIGGIGPCGRPLCCSTWITNFMSVSTGAARIQDLSLNPQKLAGQCAKLKCCLNYEVDAYLEAVRSLPEKSAHLETIDATWYFFKADVFKAEITYSSDRKIPANLTTIDAKRAFEIIEMNKKGEKPNQLKRDEEAEAEAAQNRPLDLLDQDNINRFDKKKKKKKKKRPAENADKGTTADSKPANKPESAPKKKSKRPKDGQNPTPPAE